MISLRKLNSSIQNFQFSLWTSNDNDGNHMIKLVHMMQRMMIMMDIIWIWSADSVYYSKMISWMWSKPKAHIAHHYDIFLCSLDVVIVQSQAIHDDDDDGDYEDDDDYEGSPDRGHRRSAPPRTLDPYSPVGTTPPPFAAPGSFSFAACVNIKVCFAKQREVCTRFVTVVTSVCQSHMGLSKLLHAFAKLLHVFLAKPNPNEIWQRFWSSLKLLLFLNWNYLNWNYSVCWKCNFN